MSQLSEELLNAYKATTYSVPDLALKIRIDEHNTLLKKFLTEQNLTTWTFLTAWNPKSQELPMSENRARNQSLEAQLKSQGLSSYKALGVPDNGDWTPEESLFIPGISRKQAIDLGDQFDQNAIVFGEFGKRAELLILSSGLEP